MPMPGGDRAAEEPVEDGLGAGSIGIRQHICLDLDLPLLRSVDAKKQVAH